MVMSLRSKWAVGKAVRAGLALGRISQSIRNRRATQPPAHFQRNPPGRGQLAVFPRCSLDPYESDMGALPPVRCLEKQPTDLRRRHHYMRDGTLAPSKISKENVSFSQRLVTSDVVPKASDRESKHIQLLVQPLDKTAWLVRVVPSCINQANEELRAKVVKSDSSLQGFSKSVKIPTEFVVN